MRSEPLLRLVTLGAFLLGGLVLAQQRPAAIPRQRLYLLAATIGLPVPHEYPATLYRASEGKLETVREVISGDQGVNSVRAWGGAIFVTHPASLNQAAAVSIIHENEPSREDDVNFRSDLLSGDGHFFTLVQDITAPAEPRPGSVDELLTIVEFGPVVNGRGTVSSAQFASVSTDVAANSRVRLNAWDEYVAARIEGDPGVITRPLSFPCAIVGDKLALVAAWGHPTVMDSLDSLPPSARAALTATKAHSIAADGTSVPTVVVAAADQRYLILRAASASTDVFIHDRMKNQWKTVAIEGNVSRLRFFSPWLATVVEINPGNGSNPGRENERNFDSDRLPDVHSAYAGNTATPQIPGVLVLQQIEDGRKIRIETHQEDSEILWVGGDTVLYRVNDAIHSVKISASQLLDDKIIVQDENVPEIHWVFWSK